MAARHSRVSRHIFASREQTLYGQVLKPVLLTGATLCLNQPAPVTSTSASKPVTTSPRSAVQLFVSHLRFVSKSSIAENQFDRPSLVAEYSESALTEDDILSLQCGSH